MIRINLLPIRQIKKRQRIKNEVLGFTASLVLVLAVLGFIGLAMANKIDTLNKNIKQLEQRKASFNPMLKEIDKLKKDKLALENKLTAIKQLQAGSQITVRVLDELARSTPTERMWLTALRQGGSGLQLTGVALDNETIAQYMKQLEASPYFASTDLTNSSQTVVAGQKLKSFSLNVSIVVSKQTP